MRRGNRNKKGIAKSNIIQLILIIVISSSVWWKDETCVYFEEETVGEKNYRWVIEFVYFTWRHAHIKTENKSEKIATKNQTIYSF